MADVCGHDSGPTGLKDQEQVGGDCGQSPVFAPLSPSAIMAAEAEMFGRPCRVISSHCTVFRDHNGVEHESWFVIYDASSETQGQTRWTAYTDGEQSYSGVVSVSHIKAAPTSVPAPQATPRKDSHE